MITSKVTGFGDTARMRDNCNCVFYILFVMIDALRLICWVKSTLQLRVVRGDPGGAGILITLKSLDAAQREHEATRGYTEISPHAECPGDICWRNQLAASDHLYSILQAVFVQNTDDHG